MADGDWITLLRHLNSRWQMVIGTTLVGLLGSEAELEDEPYLKGCREVDWLRGGSGGCLVKLLHL